MQQLSTDLQKPRGPWLALSAAALRHNYQQIKKHIDENIRIFAVVKADAYGHGALWVAKTLADVADGFAVATLGEALALRTVVKQPILLLHGGYPQEVAQLDFYSQLAELAIAPVIHAPWQLQALQASARALPWRQPLLVWLKLDSGMQRLGFSAESWSAAYQELLNIPNLVINFFSHFASADVPGHWQNQQQRREFQKVTQGLAGARSLANSATIVLHSNASHDCLDDCPQDWLGEWVRPGLLLYGVAPVVLPESWQLVPVMTLKSQLIAVRPGRKGEFVGYNASWQCPEDMPLGVVAIGYADGYPRALSNVGVVLVAGQRLPVRGRVSMDLLVVDLRGVPAQPGDSVTLWGQGLPVEEVAALANTIAYELLTRITGRIAAFFVD